MAKRPYLNLTWDTAGRLRLGVRAKVPPAAPPTTGVRGWLCRHFECDTFDGGGRCLWLWRWTLLSWHGWEVYLHHWVGDDWSHHHHDHSRSMVSVGLRGRYTEHILDQPDHSWAAPWVRYFPATHRHYITLNTPTVWTLVFAAPQRRHSGFWVRGERVGTVPYLRSPEAARQKRC